VSKLGVQKLVVVCCCVWTWGYGQLDLWFLAVWCVVFRCQARQCGRLLGELKSILVQVQMSLAWECIETKIRKGKGVKERRAWQSVNGSASIVVKLFSCLHLENEGVLSRSGRLWERFMYKRWQGSLEWYFSFCTIPAAWVLMVMVVPFLLLGFFFIHLGLELIENENTKTLVLVYWCLLRKWGLPRRNPMKKKKWSCPN